VHLKNQRAWLGIRGDPVAAGVQRRKHAQIRCHRSVMFWAFHCKALPSTKDHFPIEALHEPAPQSVASVRSHSMVHQENAVPDMEAGFGQKADISASPDRTSAASGLKLIPIVAASGFAGLGYEIVWTRQLSLVLGSEMMAVLGVIAGFFGGLALGAFILDRPIRRAASPRLAYALLEVVIGLWGLVSIWLLPAAARTLPPLLGTEPSPIVLWAVSFAIPALVLLPATAAMGGT